MKDHPIPALAIALVALLFTGCTHLSDSSRSAYVIFINNRSFYSLSKEGLAALRDELKPSLAERNLVLAEDRSSAPWLAVYSPPQVSSAGLAAPLQFRAVLRNPDWFGNHPRSSLDPGRSALAEAEAARADSARWLSEWIGSEQQLESRAGR
jgi:hypothetical protein